MADLVTWLRCKARVFEVYGQEKSGWAKLHTADLNAYSGKLREAAAALEAARVDAARWNELCRQIDAGEFHPAILDDAMNMGAGALEMHVDDTIDAAREARNG